MAGFATIAREESDLDTKNAMLEYLADLMEDAHDFSWASAKGNHAMLLCQMEEGKIQWTDIHKIDLVRRAHAQRFAGVQTFTNISVQSVLLKVKKTDMHPKIVLFLCQKTRQALQNCSAKCKQAICTGGETKHSA